MVRLYHLEGKSLREVGRSLGRDWSTVRHLLNRYEIPLRGRGFKNCNHTDPGDLLRLAGRLSAFAQELVSRAETLSASQRSRAS
jgi:hypothetical protein